MGDSFKSGISKKLLLIEVVPVPLVKQRPPLKEALLMAHLFLGSMQV